MSVGKALTAWQPSENQVAVLRAFQSRDYDCTMDEGCQAGGVSRQAYYLWHDEPDFSKWWAEQSDRFFRLQLARVQLATFKTATSDAPGDPRSQKLFYERFDRDYCPQSKGKQELSGPNGGAIPLQIVMFGTPPGAVDADETDPGDPAAGA